MDLLLKFQDFMDAWGIMHSDYHNPEIDEDALFWGGGSTLYQT